MEPISPHSPFQGARLKIDDLKNLKGIIHSLNSDVSLASRIKVIEVDENDDDETELDTADDPPEIAPETYEKFSIEMSKIIQEIQHHGGLEVFKWIGLDQENTRPAGFWESLWRTSSTLRSLTIQFSVHELEKISKITLPSSKFLVLETLSVDAGAAHGDNGSLVETLLQDSPAIQDLNLSFPNCDLEGCRLQGVTWQYTFSSLQTLNLRTYNSDNAALSKFLLRHPKITTLVWEVDADEGFVFPETSLPELRALSIEFRGRSELLKANVEVLAQRQHLTHLRVNGCPHASYLEITKLSKALKCLEINPGICSWRDGCREPDELDEGDEKLADALQAEKQTKSLPAIIASMLGQLRGLQELALDLETGNTYVGDDEGEWGNPDSMDVEDLKSVLSVLPKDTQIRALRLSDQRGLTLPDEVLENFPEVPPSLQYLKWDIGETKSLYRLERHGGRVKAVECEALRKFGNMENWVEERVLDF